MIGYFDDERDAAVARDRFALDEIGTRALPNFPSECLRRYRYKSFDAGRDSSGTAVSGRGSKAWCRTQPVLERTLGARIKVKRRALHLGSWPTEREVAIAYDRAVLWYRGPEAC